MHDSRFQNFASFVFNKIHNYFSGENRQEFCPEENSDAQTLMSQTPQEHVTDWGCDPQSPSESHRQLDSPEYSPGSRRIQPRRCIKRILSSSSSNSSGETPTKMDKPCPLSKKRYLSQDQKPKKKLKFNQNNHESLDSCIDSLVNAIDISPQSSKVEQRELNSESCSSYNFTKPKCSKISSIGKESHNLTKPVNNSQNYENTPNSVSELSSDVDLSESDISVKYQASESNKKTKTTRVNKKRKGRPKKSKKNQSAKSKQRYTSESSTSDKEIEKKKIKKNEKKTNESDTEKNRTTECSSDHSEWENIEKPLNVKSKKFTKNPLTKKKLTELFGTSSPSEGSFSLGSPKKTRTLSENSDSSKKSDSSFSSNKSIGDLSESLAPKSIKKERITPPRSRTSSDSSKISIDSCSKLLIDLKEPSLTPEDLNLKRITSPRLSVGSDCSKKSTDSIVSPQKSPKKTGFKDSCLSPKSVKVKNIASPRISSSSDTSKKSSDSILSAKSPIRNLFKDPEYHSPNPVIKKIKSPRLSINSDCSKISSDSFSSKKSFTGSREMRSLLEDAKKILKSTTLRRTRSDGSNSSSSLTDLTRPVTVQLEILDNSNESYRKYLERMKKPRKFLNRISPFGTRYRQKIFSKQICKTPILTSWDVMFRNAILADGFFDNYVQINSPDLKRSITSPKNIEKNSSEKWEMEKLQAEPEKITKGRRKSNNQMRNSTENMEIETKKTIEDEKLSENIPENNNLLVEPQNEGQEKEGNKSDKTKQIKRPTFATKISKKSNEKPDKGPKNKKIRLEIEDKNNTNLTILEKTETENITKINTPENVTESNKNLKEIELKAEETQTNTNEDVSPKPKFNLDFLKTKIKIGSIGNLIKGVDELKEHDLEIKKDCVEQEKTTDNSGKETTEVTSLEPKVAKYQFKPANKIKIKLFTKKKNAPKQRKKEKLTEAIKSEEIDNTSKNDEQGPILGLETNKIPEKPIKVKNTSKQVKKGTKQIHCTKSDSLDIDKLPETSVTQIESKNDLKSSLKTVHTKQTMKDDFESDKLPEQISEMPIKTKPEILEAKNESKSSIKKATKNYTKPVTDKLLNEMPVKTKNELKSVVKNINHIKQTHISKSNSLETHNLTEEMVDTVVESKNVSKSVKKVSNKNHTKQAQTPKSDNLETDKLPEEMRETPEESKNGSKSSVKKVAEKNHTKHIQISKSDNIEIDKLPEEIIKTPIEAKIVSNSSVNKSSIKNNTKYITPKSDNVGSDKITEHTSEKSIKTKKLSKSTMKNIKNNSKPIHTPKPEKLETDIFSEKSETLVEPKNEIKPSVKKSNIIHTKQIQTPEPENLETNKLPDKIETTIEPKPGKILQKPKDHTRNIQTPEPENLKTDNLPEKIETPIEPKLGRVLQNPKDHTRSIHNLEPENLETGRLLEKTETPIEPKGKISQKQKNHTKHLEPENLDTPEKIETPIESKTVKNTSHKTKNHTRQFQNVEPEIVDTNKTPEKIETPVESKPVKNTSHKTKNHTRQIHVEPEIVETNKLPEKIEIVESKPVKNTSHKTKNHTRQIHVEPEIVETNKLPEKIEIVESKPVNNTSHKTKNHTKQIQNVEPEIVKSNKLPEKIEIPIESKPVKNTCKTKNHTKQIHTLKPENETTKIPEKNQTPIDSIKNTHKTKKYEPKSKKPDIKPIVVDKKINLEKHKKEIFFENIKKIEKANEAVTASSNNIKQQTSALKKLEEQLKSEKNCHKNRNCIPEDKETDEISFKNAETAIFQEKNQHSKIEYSKPENLSTKYKTLENSLQIKNTGKPVSKSGSDQIREPENNFKTEKLNVSSKYNRNNKLHINVEKESEKNPPKFTQDRIFGELSTSELKLTKNTPSFSSIAQNVSKSSEPISENFNQPRIFDSDKSEENFDTSNEEDPELKPHTSRFSSEKMDPSPERSDTFDDLEDDIFNLDKNDKTNEKQKQLCTNFNDITVSTPSRSKETSPKEDKSKHVFKFPTNALRPPTRCKPIVLSFDEPTSRCESPKKEEFKVPLPPKKPAGGLGKTVCKGYRVAPSEAGTEIDDSISLYAETLADFSETKCNQKEKNEVSDELNIDVNVWMQNSSNFVPEREVQDTFDNKEITINRDIVRLPVEKELWVNPCIQVPNLFQFVCPKVRMYGNCLREKTCCSMHELPQLWETKLAEMGTLGLYSLYEDVKMNKELFLYKKIFPLIAQALGQAKDFNKLVCLTKDVMTVNIETDKTPFIEQIVLGLNGTGLTFHSAVEIVYKSSDVDETNRHNLSDILLSITVDRATNLEEHWGTIRMLVDNRNNLDPGLVQDILSLAIKIPINKELIYKVYGDIISSFEDAKLPKIFHTALEKFIRVLEEVNMTVEAESVRNRWKKALTPEKEPWKGQSYLPINSPIPSTSTNQEIPFSRIPQIDKNFVDNRNRILETNIQPRRKSIELKKTIEVTEKVLPCSQPVTLKRNFYPELNQETNRFHSQNRNLNEISETNRFLPTNRNLNENQEIIRLQPPNRNLNDQEKNRFQSIQNRNLVQNPSNFVKGKRLNLKRQYDDEIPPIHSAQRQDFNKYDSGFSKNRPQNDLSIPQSVTPPNILQNPHNVQYQYYYQDFPQTSNFIPPSVPREIKRPIQCFEQLSKYYQTTDVSKLISNPNPIEETVSSALSTDSDYLPPVQYDTYFKTMDYAGNTTSGPKPLIKPKVLKNNLCKDGIRAAFSSENSNEIAKHIDSCEDKDIDDFVSNAVEVLLTETHHNLPTFFRQLTEALLVVQQRSNCAKTQKILFTIGMNLLVHLSRNEKWDLANKILCTMTHKKSNTLEYLNTNYMGEKYSVSKNLLTICLILIKNNDPNDLRKAWTNIMHRNMTLKMEFWDTPYELNDNLFRDIVVSEYMHRIFNKSSSVTMLDRILTMLQQENNDVDVYKYLDDAIILAIDNDKTKYCTGLCVKLNRFLPDWYSKVESNTFRAVLIRLHKESLNDLVLTMIDQAMDLEIYPKITGDERRIDLSTDYTSEEIYLILRTYLNRVAYPCMHSLELNPVNLPRPSPKHSALLTNYLGLPCSVKVMKFVEYCTNTVCLNVELPQSCTSSKEDFTVNTELTITEVTPSGIFWNLTE